MAWLILIVAASALPATGQTLFTRPYLPSTLSVEAVRPAYENGQLSSTTGALFFTGSYTLDKNIELIGELPVAHADGETISSTTALGNPLLGLGLSSTRIPFLVEIGVRFPVSSGDVATQLAQAADYGRGAAFLEKEKQAYLLANTRFMLGRKTSIRLRSGLAFGIFEEADTSGTDVTQRDLRLRYAVQVWREGDRLITGASFTGRGITTAPGSYSDKSRHHFAFSALLDFERIAPGITIGIPLNAEDRELASFIFGASLDLRLW
ncbi:hypothetical protein [Longibacter salinarum]|nr:hypothetical protein [Longibacter salinarum]